MEYKSLLMKLKVTYFLLAGALACYYPFLILFFKDRHLDYIQMGICFAATPLIGVICQPVIGYITDKYLNKKITLIIVLSCSNLFILLFVFSKNFYTLLASIILLSMFMTSMMPLLDALCLEFSAAYRDIHYNKVRLMGSIGYSVCAALMGFIIKYTNTYIPFYGFFILNIICITLAGTIKCKQKAKSQHINPRFILNLFKNNQFVLFILSALLLNITINSNGNYIGELIKSTGGDVSNLGLLWCVVALFEVPTFFLGNKILSKFKDLRLYYLCLVFYAIRYFLNASCTSWQWVIVVQMMQAVTYALYLLAALHYLNRIVHPEMLTSGLMLHAALGNGLGGFIGNIAGGMVIQALNIYWFYKILSLVCLFSLAIAVFIEKSVNDKSNEESMLIIGR